MRLRILLVTERRERALQIERALAAARHRVIATIGPDDDLLFYAQSARPDALIAELDAPSPDFVEQLRRLDERQPCPVVVFAARSDSQAIRSAIKAGVSSYVVDGFQPARIAPVLEAAFVRFAEHQSLRSQRDAALTKLAERRTIERAKGILMQRRNLTERAAHAVLRKMALENGKRLGEISHNVVTVERLLVSQK